MIATNLARGQAEAQTRAREWCEARSAGTEAWKEAMRVVPSSEPAENVYHASLAAEATLN